MKKRRNRFYNVVRLRVFLNLGRFVQILAVLSEFRPFQKKKLAVLPFYPNFRFIRGSLVENENGAPVLAVLSEQPFYPLPFYQS
jgi:hypothetical protein